MLTKSQEHFWNTLASHCGKAFAGELLSVPADDVMFTGRKLVMHVKSCEENRIRVPFFVGENRSRTWVFTKEAGGILLKHDHRHADGSPDEVTMYGGLTSHGGSETMQVFPADSETVDRRPATIGNVWWIELINGKSFSYNLRRIHTDRLVSVLFDLTQEIDPPTDPWGWEE